ncbi:MAG: anion permease [Chitinophagia bacterium]|nr:anion permease [Chitinophagia bacterium]
MSTLLVVIIILALLFDYINGFHDAANSIATIVSTKVLTPFQAVVWAAFFNIIAYWIFQDHAVANTISKTVFKEFITLPVILSGLLAAIFWNLLTWWFGIPSSSSHTLIGGFAGAAIMHAILDKGLHVSWAKIVESDTIIKTILFIFLAPLIGMVIAIFISIVTIVRNMWLRVGIIILSTFLTVILFDKFETDKIHEGVVKFIKLDKYKEEFEKSQNNPLIKQNDSSANASFLKSKKKFETAQSNFETLHPLINDYDLLGADSIASYAYSHGLLKDVEISRLKDEVRNANNYLVLEALAAENPVKEKEYGIAKIQTELYKEPLQAYLNHQLSIDSAIVLMNSVYPIQPQNIEKVKSKISKFNIQKSFAKDIEKSDNGIIHLISQELPNQVDI